MEATTESFLFSRWPRTAARHPWRVLAGAVAVAVALGLASLAWRGSFTDQFSAPGTESQRAIDLLRQRFPQQAGDTAFVVVKADAGFDDVSTRDRVNTLLAELEALPHVVEVASPFEAHGAISPDRRIARIAVLYDARARDHPRESVEALDRLRERWDAPGFQVEVGGNVIRVIERPEMGRAELVGISAAVVVLLVAFGSVVAMVLPIGTALLALGLGLLVISLATRFVALPSFTPQFAAMIGLGVGIDYALLIVTRFREALSRGLEVEDAVVEASSTAGRSVLFAGGTVVVAMLGLWAIGTRFVADLGTAAAVIVAFSVAVALLVTPAMLAVVGRAIDRWRAPFVPAVTPESERGFGYRLSRVIQRAPLPALLLGLGLLVTLALPLTRIRLGSSDAGSNPTSFTSRRAYDLLSEGFGPGFNGPILIAASIDDPRGARLVEQLPDRLSGLPGVAFVAPPRFNRARTAATITLVPVSAPDARETSTLVHALRQRLRQEIAGSGVTAYVGGTTAAFIDIGERITARLPALIAIVIGLSFALLMMAFRSIVVPVKAALMNLLDHRRRLWRRRGRLPVGMARANRRRRPRRSYRVVFPDVPVRHPVRALVGLRGVSREPHPGGVPADGGRQRGGGAWPLPHDAPHLGRGRDHGRRLSELRLRRPARHQGVRRRARHGGVPRRDRRASRAGAVGHAAARRGELVVPRRPRPCAPAAGDRAAVPPRAAPAPAGGVDRQPRAGRSWPNGGPRRLTGAARGRPPYANAATTSSEMRRKTSSRNGACCCMMKPVTPILAYSSITLRTWAGVPMGS